MKMMITFLFLASGAECAFAECQSPVSQMNGSATDYVVNARAEPPLFGDRSCSPYSLAGQIAKASAENEAGIRCRNDMNTDCIVQGVSYQIFISNEVIGYQACDVKVYLRGYRIH